LGFARIKVVLAQPDLQLRCSRVVIVARFLQKLSYLIQVKITSPLYARCRHMVKSAGIAMTPGVGFRKIRLARKFRSRGCGQKNALAQPNLQLEGCDFTALDHRLHQVGGKAITQMAVIGDVEDKQVRLLAGLEGAYGV